MLGFDAAERYNRSIANLTHAEDLESTTAGLERLWGGELTHLDVEMRYVRKDGSALWVRVSTSLVHGGGAEAEFRSNSCATYPRARRWRRRCCKTRRCSLP